MTKDLLILLFAAPLAAVVLSFGVRSSRLSEYATVIAAIVDLAVSVPLLVRVLHGPVVLAHSYVQVDLLGAWVILCISIVYTLSSIYAVGYMRLLNEKGPVALCFTDCFPALPSPCLQRALSTMLASSGLRSSLRPSSAHSWWDSSGRQKVQKQPGSISSWFQVASASLYWAQCSSIGAAPLSLGRAMQ